MTNLKRPNAQYDKLEQYHQYLETNYKCGVQRFFSPTGALANFQKSVTVAAAKTRDIVIARNVDDAANQLRPIIDRGEGVHDLTAEPGTGKTSVLPFKFPTKRVVVALPTPFDAWSAYQVATGEAMLRLKGLTLGKECNVCYMDSYMAANMVLAGFVEYDILIVDECDSGKGVTKFLADVASPGKVIIRMSASHGRTESGPSRSFPVTEDTTLPDIRNDFQGFVQMTKAKLQKRSLVLLPDSKTAEQVSELIPGSKLITSSGSLADLAERIVDQTGNGVFVADDVCARGLNLNLDVLVDSQLVTEHGVTRHLTEAELYQRKNRLGRSKSGWYVSPGLSSISLRESEADVLRSNILRVIAGIGQEGPSSRHITYEDARVLLCSEVEPITVHRFKTEVDVMSVTSVKPLASRPSAKRSSSTSDSSGSTRGKSSRSSGSKNTVSSPSWMNWLVKPGAKELIGGKSYYVSESVDRVVVRTESASFEACPESKLALRPKHRRHHSRELPVALSAPYAVAPKRRDVERVAAVQLPAAPPTVDLTEMEYHMDWPSVFKDCVNRGMDLPTIVPPGNWRHTSTGGMGTNWMLRLDALSIGELSFTEGEFELVCRAWNKMVAQSWVKRTPGLSSLENEDRVEFCVRYFQSYFQMSSL